MRRWYVIYTRSRAEKKTANRLEEEGFEVYCPLKEEVRQWSDRKKKVKVAVLPSYVFIKLENYGKERIDVLNIPGVLRFLWWIGKPATVREEEIKQLKEFLSEYRHTRISVSFKKGEKVVINQGPFKEHKGIIIDFDRRKAILQLESIGIMLKAQLPLSMLKKMRG